MLCCGECELCEDDCPPQTMQSPQSHVQGAGAHPHSRRQSLLYYVHHLQCLKQPRCRACVWRFVARGLLAPDVCVHHVWDGACCRVEQQQRELALALLERLAALLVVEWSLLSSPHHHRHHHHQALRESLVAH